MQRKEQFVPGEYYHVYNRTILSIPEFKEYKNAKKLHEGFLLANSTESSRAFDYLRATKNASFRKAVEIALRGEKFVDVIAYSIMPDHYHLLLRELTEKGITSFVRKLNISIAKHINTKNERKGTLFEGNFKAKHVDSNKYLLHLSLYIHLNPLDFIGGKEWRRGDFKKWSLKKKEFFEYPWSSLKAFLYKDYDDWILSGTEIILNQFSGGKDYGKFLEEWSAASLEKIGDLIIN